jgi:hypothetical protein
MALPTCKRNSRHSGPYTNKPLTTRILQQGATRGFPSQAWWRGMHLIGSQHARLKISTSMLVKATYAIIGDNHCVLRLKSCYSCTRCLVLFEIINKRSCSELFAIVTTSGVLKNVETTSNISKQFKHDTMFNPGLLPVRASYYRPAVSCYHFTTM